MAELQLYGSFLVKALLGEVDMDSGNVKVALLDNGHTPNRDTHDYFDDVSVDEVPATGGYTAGGAAVGSPTLSYIPDSSATAHAVSTEYQLGDIVRPATANDHIYVCVAAGTSGGTAPTWTTGRGDLITDGTVEWQEAGIGYVRFDGADVVWTSSTITARYAVYYYSTGTASTSALIAIVDFGSDQSSSNGNFSLLHDPTGIVCIPVR